MPDHQRGLGVSVVDANQALGRARIAQHEVFLMPVGGRHASAVRRARANQREDIAPTSPSSSLYSVVAMVASSQ